MRKNRKGAVLIMVMIFLLISAIASVVLYNSVYNLARMVGIGESERIKGYYADLGALRYTMGIIDNPGSYFIGINPIVLPASGVTIGPYNVRTTQTAFGSLAVDLGLSASETLFIDITNNGNGTYTVSATYTY